MATHILRTHRKAIMIAIIVPLSAAFVYWGTPLGSGGASSAPVNNIAIAAGTPITVQEFNDALLIERQRQSQMGRQVTLDELVQTGVARNLLQNLIDRELLRAAAEETGYTFDRELLADYLKDDPYFKNEDGTFNAERWNNMIDAGVNGGWESQYQRIASDLRYNLYLDRIMASARVFEPEIRDRFKEQYELRETRISVKAAAIEPEVNPTEEEVRARFDEEPTFYEKPEERTIEYVAWSLVPPMPPEAATIVERARGGESFETLVDEFSQGPFKDAGGEIGWITRTITTPEHQLVLFDMEVGGVSEPISGPGGYYIFLVEEKRESEVTGALDVRVRQILLSPELEVGALEAMTAEAEALTEKVEAGGSLADSGLEVKTASPVSTDAESLEGIPQDDFFTVRGATLSLDEGMYSSVIEGARNLYVARVTEVKPAEPRPFEEVQDEVREDVITLTRRAPEYVSKRMELAKEIAEKAKSFDEIRAQYPDLPLEVKTVPEFSAMEYDFQSGPMWQAGNVVQAVADVELGEMVGPISDFLGVPYFVELIQRTTPEEGAWETEWEAQREAIMESQQMAAQQERLEDYLAHIRLQYPWSLDDAMFAQLMATSAPEVPETPAVDEMIELPPMEIDLMDEPAADIGEAAEEMPAEDVAVDAGEAAAATENIETAPDPAADAPNE